MRNLFLAIMALLIIGCVSESPVREEEKTLSSVGTEGKEIKPLILENMVCWLEATPIDEYNVVMVNNKRTGQRDSVFYTFEWAKVGGTLGTTTRHNLVYLREAQRGILWGIHDSSLAYLMSDSLVEANFGGTGDGWQLKNGEFEGWYFQ